MRSFDVAARLGTWLPRLSTWSGKLSLFTERWSPKVIARVNDYDVKVVKVKGEFVWHRHEDTDELFLVLRGRLRIQMREGAVEIGLDRCTSYRRVLSTVLLLTRRRTPCYWNREEWGTPAMPGLTDRDP